MYRIFGAIGIAVALLVSGVLLAVNNERSFSTSSNFKLPHFSDSNPIWVCDDFRSRCRMVENNILQPIPIAATDDPLPVIAQSQPQRLGADYASAITELMMPIIVPIVAGFIVDLIIKIRTFFGQNTTDAQRDRLRSIAENATNLAIHKVGAVSSGNMPMPTKEQVMAEAVDYVQAHGVETIKALGMDPTDPKTVQAIKGHIATILAQKQADSSAGSA